MMSGGPASLFPGYCRGELSEPRATMLLQGGAGSVGPRSQGGQLNMVPMAIPWSSGLGQSGP